MALAWPLLKADLQPVLADDREPNVALADRLIEMFPKIDAEGNAIDVHENRVLAEVRVEAVVEPAGGVRAVIAAIGQKDLEHGNYRRYRESETPIDC